MKRHGRPTGWLLPAAVMVLAAVLAGARGQQFIQYGFEARDPVWVPRPAESRQ